MELKQVTAENLAQEHICCAIASEKDCQVASKKAWLADRFPEGLRFVKGDVRGKCFIEYLPAEAAWAPVCADGYFYVDCLWVSGQFKGQGNSVLLLTECLRDARASGRRGLAVLSSERKRPFLSDPGYLEHAGFRIADAADPYFVLYYLPFDASAPVPRFAEQAKHPRVDREGFLLYYSAQCPYPAKYVPLTERLAVAHGAPFSAVRLSSGAEARRAPTPFPTYSLFFNGDFVTYEIQSEARFETLLKEKGF